MSFSDDPKINKAILLFVVVLITTLFKHNFVHQSNHPNRRSLRFT